MKEYTIYTISCQNEIRYIGVTSTSINKRFSQHKYNTKHVNRRQCPVHKWMWSCINKGETLSIEVLDTCLECNWEWTEQYWISQFKSWGFKLLNLDIGGKGVVLKDNRTQSSIDKSKNAHKKRVAQIDWDGNIIKVFDSLTQAAQEMHLKSISNITESMKYTNKMIAGYFWRFIDSSNKISSPIDFSNNKLSIFCYDGTTGQLLKSYRSAGAVFDDYDLKYNWLSILIKNRLIWKKYNVIFTRSKQEKIDITKFNVCKITNHGFKHTT